MQTHHETSSAKRAGKRNVIVETIVAVLLAILVLLMAKTVIGALTPQTPIMPIPANIYSDGKAPGNHYYPSGWMGDWGDLKVDESYALNPRSGETCIRIDYSAEGSNGAGWAGIYWQNPRNNWGIATGGYDITGAKKLVFWARGEKGGELIDKFQLGGIQGRYTDTAAAGIGPVRLSAEWTVYEIDLTGRDLSRIIGGFMFVANAQMNPKGFVIYLDDIHLE